jgi:hypothetical protein
MNDTPLTQRRFWQIHLSTMLAASLIAGLLLFANVTETIVTSEDNGHTFHTRYAGWPFRFRVENPRFDSTTFRFVDRGWWSNLEARKAFFLNCNLCIILQVVSTVAIEWVTRRMKRRPTP